MFPSLIASDDVIRPNTVTKGANTITPDEVFVDQDQIYVPVVTFTGGTVTLVPTLVEDVDLFYSTLIGFEPWEREAFLSGAANDVSLLGSKTLEQTLEGVAPDGTPLKGTVRDGIYLIGDDVEDIELEGTR